MDCWSITSILIPLLMPLAVWTGPFRDDFLMVSHPIALYFSWVGWRRNGVIHAEVYTVALWILSYLAWTLALLAPAEWFLWEIGDTGLFAELVDHFGVAKSWTYVLVASYVGSGVAAVTCATALARIVTEPSVKPLIVVVAWMPFVYFVWAIAPVFHVLGLVMSVGMAGFAISREVRRMRDTEVYGHLDAGRPLVTETPSTAPHVPPLGLMVVALSVVAGVSIGWTWSLVNPAGQATAIIGAWSITLLASSFVYAWFHFMKRSDGIPWAASAFIAVTSGLSLASLSQWLLTPESATNVPAFDLFDIIVIQATALVPISLAAATIAVAKGVIGSYGAMLTGFLYIPIMLYSADLHAGSGRLFALADPAGVFGAMIMGGVTLFIMWRAFGPGAPKPPVAANV